jgi:hypothetical protein
VVTLVAVSIANRQKVCFPILNTESEVLVNFRGVGGPSHPRLAMYRVFKSRPLRLRPDLRQQKGPGLALG